MIAADVARFGEDDVSVSLCGEFAGQERLKDAAASVGLRRKLLD